MNDARLDHRCALDGFGRVLGAAADDGDPTIWDRPSPCSEWSARDIVGHVLAVQHAIVATIAGERAPMNPMVEPGRHAGDDPVAAWADALAAVRAATDAPDALERRVNTWRGEQTVAELLTYNVGDITIHTWDLARATGGDDHLDPHLVELALVLYEPIAGTMRAPSIFGEAIAVAPGSPPQDRLLALVGRSPD